MYVSWAVTAPSKLNHQTLSTPWGSVRVSFELKKGLWWEVQRRNASSMNVRCLGRNQAALGQHHDFCSPHLAAFCCSILPRAGRVGLANSFSCFLPAGNFPVCGRAWGSAPGTHSSGWAKAHGLSLPRRHIQELGAAWGEGSSTSCLELGMGWLCNPHQQLVFEI